VKPDHLDELRQWFKTVNGPRRDEALATLSDEGCRHEQAIFFSDSEGPVLLHVMEVENIEQSRQVAESSRHPIDADHRRMMASALDDTVEVETILDLIQDP
jgi:hypothetical protein